MNEIYTIPLYNYPKSRQTLPKKDIIRASSDINYTTFHLIGGKRVTIARTLGKFEDLLLPHNGFLRPHRGHIINLAYIEAFECHGNTGTLLLKDGCRIAVSRRRMKTLKDKFINP